jgi:O-acetyl-ADP-ribose deacetylase (regulator of RNase III)
MNLKKLTNRIFKGSLDYPKGGEVYEALQDTQISYLTHFMAPYTGGDKAIILKGERILVSEPNNPKPSGYYCYPLNADEVEIRIVPSSDRNDPQYNGFSLFIDTSSINQNFRQIELMPINYKKGDATNPTSDSTKIIVHICNDVGGWGKGFVMAISKKWKEPEAEYRTWHKDKIGTQTDNVQFERLERRDKYSNERKFELGNVQFVKVSKDLWVANMIAQRNIRPDKDGLPPIRYPFVSEGLERVREFAKRQNASVHMPRIGCGLAGGEWIKIEELVNDHLIAYEIDTTVYDFE